MSAVPDPSEHYRREFARAAPRLSGAGLSWLQELRRRALDNFCATGFPTTRQEDWKYTNIAAMVKRDFQLATGADGALDRDALARFRLPDTAQELVFVNGCCNDALSVRGALPDGVSVSTLSRLFRDEPDMLAQRLASADSDSAFALLNQAFVMDGAVLRLENGVELPKPIHFLFVTNAAGEASWITHPKILISLGAGSRADIITSFVSLGATPHLTNSVSEITVHEHAVLNHYTIQDQHPHAYHVDNITIAQSAGSRVSSYAIAMGAALARTDLKVDLKAPGAGVELNGLYLGRGRQHVDFHTRIDHLAPHTQSRQFYKGILDDSARGVFNGKIVVHKKAQKADARQYNRNLLLSANAEADTKPELEIYTDDVACAHGATVGQLNQDELFCLRTRGIDYKVARSLLTHAFAWDVIERIKLTGIRQKLDQEILGHLPEAELIEAFV